MSTFFLVDGYSKHKSGAHIKVCLPWFSFYLQCNLGQPGFIFNLSSHFCPEKVILSRISFRIQHESKPFCAPLRYLLQYGFLQVKFFGGSLFPSTVDNTYRSPYIAYRPSIIGQSKIPFSKASYFQLSFYRSNNVYTRNALHFYSSM